MPLARLPRRALPRKARPAHAGPARTGTATSRLIRQVWQRCAAAAARVPPGRLTGRHGQLEGLGRGSQAGTSVPGSCALGPGLARRVA